MLFIKLFTSVNVRFSIANILFFLTNVFFGGHFTDSLNESRAITRQAFIDLKFDAYRMNSTEQMSVRGLKKRQKIVEIVGNEGKRLGGKKNMNAVPVGADLSVLIIKEFIFWRSEK